MKWKLVIDPSSEDVTVTVTAPSETEEVREIERLLAPISAIECRRDGEVRLVEPRDIVRFFTEGKGVAAETENGEVYSVALRLYELEERLSERGFARISSGELVNLRKVTALDLSLSGTIRLTLAGGGAAWVSRRNVKGIKRALGL